MCLFRTNFKTSFRVIVGSQQNWAESTEFRVPVPTWAWPPAVTPPRPAAAWTRRHHRPSGPGPAPSVPHMAARIRPHAVTPSFAETARCSGCAVPSPPATTEPPPVSMTLPLPEGPHRWTHVACGRLDGLLSSVPRRFFHVSSPSIACFFLLLTSIPV